MTVRRLACSLLPFLSSMMVSCEMAASKNPLITGAQSIQISSNISAGKAWRLDTTLVSSKYQEVPVSGLDLVGAVIQQLPQWQITQIPAASLTNHFAKRSFISKLGQRSIPPRADTDLVLWIEVNGPSYSYGYYNAAAGVGIPGAAVVDGCQYTEERTLGNLRRGMTACVFNAYLFDAKSGEQLSTNLISVNEARQGSETIQQTLRRAVNMAANDTVIALGLKSGKTHSLILRQETQTRQQSRDATDAVFDPLTDRLSQIQDRLNKSRDASWERNKKQWRRLFGVKADPTAPAAAPGTSAP